MSRSNNIELINPAEKDFAWDGAKGGGFIYFDKSKGEEGEKVKVALPFKFLALDTLSTIRGYSKAEKTGYWGNEVRDITNEAMVVRVGRKVVAKGTYANIKDAVKAGGGKYCQTVYIAIKDGKNMRICRLLLVGTALSAWLEFRKKNKIFDGAIEVLTDVEGKNGATVFRTPVFTKALSSPQADEIAKKLDLELQAYLTERFKLDKSKMVEKENVETVIAEAKTIPVEEQLPQGREEVIVGEEIDDLPF